jgi:flagellar basal-body rod modification protein FlgD
MTAASGLAPPVVSGTTPLPTSSSSGSSGSSLSSTTDSTLAGNFQTFLTLLTTQLQNQNPLDPLDTNQFTQQLVQFASVEQQLKTNDQLTTLVSLQQTAQSTQALTFVGKTAVVDGSTAALTSGAATWELGVPTNANVTISIANSTGQTVFTGSYAVNAGDNQVFTWNGRGNDGTQWPDGKYTRPRPQPTARPIPWLSRPRYRGWSIRSISPSRRRYCRSTARITRSTRSRASPTSPLRAFGLARSSPTTRLFIHNSLRRGISRPSRRILLGIFKEILIEALGLGKF